MLSRWLLIRVLFPLAEFSGRFLPDAWRDSLEKRLVSANNRLSSRAVRGPRKLLLLLPHCIQLESCDRRLVFDAMRCRRCGKCPIAVLLTIGEKNNIIIKVATGGRLARRIVKDISPDAVIAVACERELSEGIPGVFPLPVFAVTNLRPSGPCINTTVDIEALERTIAGILNNGK